MCIRDSLGGLQVDDQFDFGNLLDRQVGGLLALEDTAGIDANPTERIRKTASVAHQAASLGELAKMVDRGYRVADRQYGELFKPATEECIAANHEPARSQLDQLCEDTIELTFGAGIQYMELQPEGTSCCLHLLRVGLGKSGIGRIDEQGHDARRGEQLVQQLQPLRRYLLHVCLGRARD